MADTLFDELGGMACLEKVHRIFYGKLLSDSWLKGFFDGVPRPHLEAQQSDFMAGLFGGPKVYAGKLPRSAHKHMFITEEVFLARHDLLKQSLVEASVRPDLMARWLDYDMRMKKALVKASVEDCEQRYNNEAVLVVEKPALP